MNNNTSNVIRAVGNQGMRCSMRAISGKVATIIGLATLAMSSTASAEMGRTAGSWSVSPSGAATYSVPIWVQPGPKGIQPSLAFNYNSQSGNGTMGVGWGLSGVGSIERCRSTIGEDGVDNAVLATAADRFCINGSKLRITSGPLSSYGTAGAVYQTQIADFSRITSVGTQGTGPQSWIVHAKSGLIYEYGNTADSRVSFTGSTVFRWLLNKVSDREGNSYSVTYTTDNTVGRVPLTISWSPTAAGGSAYQYQAAFNYSVKSNPKDMITVIEQGFSVTTKYRLDSVTIGYSASGSSYSTKRQYLLTYVASPTTQYSRLTQIKECAATTSNCLLPTAITYQDGAAGVNTTATTALASPGGAALAGNYDFNGDGRSDVAYWDGSRWRVAFSYGNSISAGVDTGITNSAPPVVGRFLANHQDAFATGIGGVVSYVAYNGTAFTSTSTGTTIPSGAILTDYNGDGLSDFIWASAASNAGSWYATVYLKMNNSAGAVAVPTFDPTTYTPLVTNLGQYGGNVVVLPLTRCPIERMCDVNGDGRADQVIQLITTLHCNGGVGGCQPMQATYDLLTSGFGYYTANQSNSSVSYLGMRFNDDNCTDVIIPGNTTMRVSSCGTGGNTSVTLPAQPLTVMDWDGDGRSDLIVNNAGTIGAYLSKGSTTSPWSSLITTSIAYNANCVYFAADVEGDGLDELGCVRAGTPYSVVFYTHKGGGSVGAGSGNAVFATQVPDLVKNITDGYGISISPNYVSLVQSNYTRGINTALPLVDANDAMYAVGRMTVSDGIGGTYNMDYNYKGARRNSVLGNRPASYARDADNKPLAYKPENDGAWAGFEEMSVVDSRDSKTQRTTFEQLFPLIGMTKKQEMIQANQTSTISRATITNLAQALDSTANNQRYFRYASQISTDKYEVGGPIDGQLITTAVQTFGYNDFTYGNVTTVTTVTTDKDAVSSPSGLNQTWTSTVTNSYDPPLTTGNDWCVGFLTQSQLVQASTAPGATSVTRTTGFTSDSGYPSKCRLKVTTTEPSSAKYKVTETYSYDGFGNVSSTSVVGRTPTGPGTYADMPARVLSIDWGTTGQFPTTITDPLGAVTTNTYNFDLGTVQKAADPNSTASNLVETSYQYDLFGRPTRVTRPNGTYTTRTYSDCNSTGCVYSRHVLTVADASYDKTGALLNDDFTYIDALDRPLVSRSRALGGTTWDGNYRWLEVDYDAIGRKSHEYLPCKTSSISSSCANASSTYSYDAIGRITQIARPRSAIDSTLQSTSYTFSGRTQVSTDAQGKSSTRVLTPSATIRQIKDANNYAINFTYDAAGSLLAAADSQGATRLSGVTVEYGFTPFQTAATDAAFGSSTRTYDSLGELVGWTDARGQAFSATYDKLFRILTRTEPDTTTTLTYGSSAASYNIGRVQSKSSTAAGQTYTENFSYDNRTRLQTRSLTIPGDASYGYDYAYDANTGRLDILTYPVTTSSYRLALKYSYQNGDLQKVSDANLPSLVFWTANSSNAFGQTTQETLGNGVVTNRAFDAITGRLMSIQSGPSGNPTAIQNQSYLYDLVGNVTQRQNNKLSLTETFYYGSASDNLYRLEHSSLNNGSTSATNLSVTYDPSGNILSKNEVGQADLLVPQSITWTSANYPSQITSGSESADFNYGPDRNRWRMAFTTGGTTEITYYIGDGLEKVVAGGVTDFRHSIRVGGQAVAIYSRKSTGTNVLRYVMTDHLGSVEGLADASGTNVANESFSAFGDRRNSATWSGAPTDRSTLDAITRQGFTYQTVLGSMGFTHMNGRVQDAVTGRFISADPHVTDPNFTQDYNRYAYVNNNPLTYVDPTGFDKLCGDNHQAYDNQTDEPLTEEQENSATNGYQNGSTTAGTASYTCGGVITIEDGMQTISTTPIDVQMAAVQRDIQRGMEALYFAQLEANAPNLDRMIAMGAAPGWVRLLTDDDEPAKPAKTCANPSRQNNPELGNNMKTGMAIGGLTTFAIALAAMTPQGEAMLMAEGEGFAMSGNAMGQAAASETRLLGPVIEGAEGAHTFFAAGQYAGYGTAAGAATGLIATEATCP